MDFKKEEIIMDIIYAPYGHTTFFDAIEWPVEFIQAIIPHKIYIYKEEITEEYEQTTTYHRLDKSLKAIDQKINDSTIDKFDLIVLDQDLGKTINYATAKPHIVKIGNYQENRTNPAWIKAVKQNLTNDLNIATIPYDNHYLIVGNDERGERVIYSKSEIKTI